jgi:hypothetical protein
VHADRNQIVRNIWSVHPVTSGHQPAPVRDAMEDRMLTRFASTLRRASCPGPPARNDIRTSIEAAGHRALELDLCSAPYKALRFASTALARGLRALTAPARRTPSWQLRNGQQFDACDNPQLMIRSD